MNKLKMHKEYLKYLIRHKWYVFVAGQRTLAPVWRLIVHDMSKFRWSEWKAYAEHFYGDKSPIIEHQKILADQRLKAFYKAFLLHLHRNQHHWQYYVLQGDHGGTRALEMPEDVVREMVADWMGAGKAITGKWEVQQWYAMNQYKMILHPNTKRLVEMVLSGVGTDEK